MGSLVIFVSGPSEGVSALPTPKLGKGQAELRLSKYECAVVITQDEQGPQRIKACIIMSQGHEAGEALTKDS